MRERCVDMPSPLPFGEGRIPSGFLWSVMCHLEQHLIFFPSSSPFPTKS